MPEARLSFSTDLYAVSAIQRSVEAFDDVAAFEVNISEQETVVTLSDPDADPDAVAFMADEFANYVLNETIIVARAPNVDVST